MSCISIGLLICMFTAVSLATLYRDPDSTTEWSVTESVREAGQGAGEELGALLDAGDGAVVTLEAGGTRLAVHRAVLAARSPALESMLPHYSVEAGGGLSVPDMEGPVLRRLLAYLYTLRAPRLPPGAATQLLAAAHRFGLPALQADCERQVAEQLSVETAATAAVLAVKHSANHLRDTAINFIKDHFVEVLASKGWADAVENQPREVIKVTLLLAGRMAKNGAPATTEAETSASIEVQTTTTTEAGTTTTTEAGTTTTTEAGTTEAGTTTTTEAGTTTTTEAGTTTTTEAGTTTTSEAGTTTTTEAGTTTTTEAGTTTTTEAGTTEAGTTTTTEAGTTTTTEAGTTEAGTTTTTEAGTTEAGTTTTTEAGTTTTSEAGTTTTTEAGTTTTTESGTTAGTQPRSSASQTPGTAAPPLASCPTAPLDEATVSRLRSLSGEDRDSRLIQAAERGAVGELRALLAAGADVVARDGRRWTPLHWAAYKGREEAASCLLGAGAWVHARDNMQRTPLHQAAWWGHAAAARLLLAASADPNARSDDGNTPLHWAAIYERAEAVPALLEAGADRGARNARGRTPLDEARSRGYQHLFEMLTQR